MENCTRVYPVYTWHANELMILDWKVSDLLERRKAKSDDFERWFLGDLHDRLNRIFQLMTSAKDKVIYLDRSDRQFIEKVANWVKNNPEGKVS